MWRPLRALLLGLTLLALLGPGKCVPIPEDAAAQADDARALRMRLEVVPGADFGKAIGALPKAIASKLRVWEEDVAIEELDARTAIWGEVLISSTTESGAVSSLVEKWDEVQEPLRASLQPFIGDNVVVSLISGDVQKATLLLRGDVPSGNDGDDEAATEREVELVKSVCEGGALEALFQRLGYDIHDIKYANTDAEKRARVLVAITGLEAEDDHLLESLEKSIRDNGLQKDMGEFGARRALVVVPFVSGERPKLAGLDCLPSNRTSSTSSTEEMDPMCPPPGGGGGGGGGAPSPPPAVPTASVQLSYSVSGPGVLSLSPGIVSNVLTTIAQRAGFGGKSVAAVVTYRMSSALSVAAPGAVGAAALQAALAAAAGASPSAVTVTLGGAPTGGRRLRQAASGGAATQATYSISFMSLALLHTASTTLAPGSAVGAQQLQTALGAAGVSGATATVTAAPQFSAQVAANVSGPQQLVTAAQGNGFSAFAASTVLSTVQSLHPNAAQVTVLQSAPPSVRLPYPPPPRQPPAVSPPAVSPPLPLRPPSPASPPYPPANPLLSPPPPTKNVVVAQSTGVNKKAIIGGVVGGGGGGLLILILIVVWCFKRGDHQAEKSTVAAATHQHLETPMPAPAGPERTPTSSGSGGRAQDPKPKAEAE